LKIVAASQEMTLNKGDSIHYRADAPHSIINAGKGAVEAFMIVRYRE
jgi:quercetin dioxygenase-like cupin family protein